MTNRIAAALVVLLTVGVARADTNKAKQFYGEARTAYNLSDYARALDLFKKAYQEHPDSAFLFNIAQCERALARYDEAERSYRAYLRESPELPEQRVAEIKVLIGAMAAAAREERARLPPPGTEPPHVAQQKAPTPPPPVAYVDTGKPMRIAGIVTADVGVGLVALGAVFAGLSYKEGQDAFHPSSGVYDHNADARSSAYRSGEIACFVIGGAAVAVGTTVWLLGRKRRETPRPGTARVQLTATGVRF